MDVLESLPLPLEIIRLIASYDRWLSVKKLLKSDGRFDIVKNIPKKKNTQFAIYESGYKINFSNPHHKLFMRHTEKEIMFAFVNIFQDESDVHIYK
jgi:energy-coupling factor transporter ATP-binding protein EcfA2